MSGYDVFVGGVGSGTDGSHAVQGGYAERGGEIAVGAAAGGSLVERESHQGGHGLGLMEEADGARLALHGRTVDAAGDGELASFVRSGEAAEHAIHAGRVCDPGYADVDVGRAFGSNDVGTGATGDDAGVDGDAAGEVGEAGDALDEAGHLEDGGVAVLEVDAGVCGYSLNVEVEVADAFAGGFVGQALSGLEDEDGGGLLGKPFGGGAGDDAADLLVRVEEEGYGEGYTELLEGRYGFECHDDPRLHVEDAGAIELTLSFAPGHFGEGADGPDGVQVAEKKDGVVAAAGGAKVELEDVAKGLLAVALDGCAELGRPLGDEGAGAVDGGFIFAGGFGLH